MNPFPHFSNHIRRLSGLVVISFAFTACAPKEATVESDPVAIHIGDKEIRLSELQKQIDYSVAKGTVFPGDEAAFIERYIERQILLENAYAQGLENDIELQRQWENLLIGRIKQRELQTQLALVSVSDEEVQAYYSFQ